MKEKIKPLYLVIKKIFNGMLIFSDIGWCFFFGGGGAIGSASSFWSVLVMLFSVYFLNILVGGGVWVDEPRREHIVLLSVYLPLAKL